MLRNKTHSLSLSLCLLSVSVSLCCSLSFSVLTVVFFRTHCALPLCSHCALPLGFNVSLSGGSSEKKKKGRTHIAPRICNKDVLLKWQTSIRAANPVSHDPASVVIRRAAFEDVLRMSSFGLGEDGLYTLISLTPEQKPPAIQMDEKMMPVRSVARNALTNELMRAWARTGFVKTDLARSEYLEFHWKTATHTEISLNRDSGLGVVNVRVGDCVRITDTVAAVGWLLGCVGRVMHIASYKNALGTGKCVVYAFVRFTSGDGGTPAHPLSEQLGKHIKFSCNAIAGPSRSRPKPPDVWWIPFKASPDSWNSEVSATSQQKSCVLTVKDIPRPSDRDLSIRNKYGAYKDDAVLQLERELKYKNRADAQQKRIKAVNSFDGGGGGGDGGGGGVRGGVSGFGVSGFGVSGFGVSGFGVSGMRGGGRGSGGRGSGQKDGTRKGKRPIDIIDTDEPVTEKVPRVTVEEVMYVKTTHVDDPVASISLLESEDDAE